MHHVLRGGNSAEPDKHQDDDDTGIVMIKATNVRLGHYYNVALDRPDRTLWWHDPSKHTQTDPC